MTEPTHFKAIPTLDKSAVVFISGTWRMRIAAADLARWVRLYREWRDRLSGKYSKFYAQPTEALEAAAKAMAIPVPDLRPKPKAVK
ncbi:hypothetical protein [Cypionkella sp.]|uniref:hypothetical protein n=1 Tax=Cypionkella sp. TaxID=2811411 RepID=UPI00271D300F|nr:hypothetical protein [Cypionkella sp.]MDO8983040.1 hypothetical protein [Cypionkella sp.]